VAGGATKLLLDTAGFSQLLRRKGLRRPVKPSELATRNPLANTGV
jgi:hypothetical protein